MRCMTAIWPAGPPELSKAMRSHTRNASRSETPWPAAPLSVSIMEVRVTRQAPVSIQIRQVPEHAGNRAGRSRAYRVAQPSLVRGRRRIIGEIHVAVRLGPQSDASGNRRRQRMLEIELAVEIAFDLVAGDANLEVVPLPGRGRRVPNPFHRRALAFFEFPQHEVVFQTIGADRQIVPVGLQVEQDSGALVDAAGESLEAHGNFSVAELLHILEHHIGEIRVGLNAIEKFGVALAVERARLVG